MQDINNFFEHCAEIRLRIIESNTGPYIVLYCTGIIQCLIRLYIDFYYDV